MKPSYNSVDMIEVELFDDDRSPRNFSKELTAVSTTSSHRQTTDRQFPVFPLYTSILETDYLKFDTRSN